MHDSTQERGTGASVPAFLASPTRPDEAPGGPRWLVVHQVWDQLVLDSQVFRPGQDVSVGGDVGWRWRVLGVDFGPVPRPLRRVLPLLAPGWSEVSEEPRASFHVPDSLADDTTHPLFEWTGEGWAAWVRDGWPVAVERDGRSWSLAELVEAGAARPDGPWVRMLVHPDQRVAIKVGTVTFAAWTSPRSAMTDRAPSGMEPATGFSLGMTSSLALALLAVVAFSPARTITDVADIPDRMVEQLAVHVPPPPPPTPTSAGSGPSSPADASPSVPEPPSKPRTDKEVAENAGALSVLQAGAFGGLFGDANLAGLAAATDGWIVSKGSPGGGGLGTRGGLGPGGLGDVDGSGEWQLSGRGSGAGDLCVSGNEAHCTKRFGDVTPDDDRVITIGALTRAQVDEVVRNHLAQVRYCYQRELQREPNLSGKLVVKFSIAPGGTVSDARTQRSTLAHAGVERCVTERFLRMKFPPPAGAGVVVVSYPFLFNPS